MSESEIKKIEERLKRLEAAVFGSRKVVAERAKTRGSSTQDFSGATGGIRFLLSKGFFKQKRGLAEIRSALSKNGYHYSRQAAHQALGNLTQKGGPLVSLTERGRKLYADRK